MRDDKLANALGWASVGLGVPQTLAPRRFAEAVGVRPDDRVAAITRYACGLRELNAAAGILKVSDPPTMWIWSRVAGDLLDLALLGSAFKDKALDRRRLTYAAGAVAGVAALDLYAALALSSKRKGEPEASPEVEVEKDEIAHSPSDKVAVTIRHPRAGLERMWREQIADDPPDWMEGATVSFSDAPGDRGTEILVQLSPPSGAGAAIGRLVGDALDTKAKDDLRRFKQAVETGEVVRAEGTPEGQSGFRMLKQRPAQPQEQTSEPGGTR